MSDGSGILAQQRGVTMNNNVLEQLSTLPIKEQRIAVLIRHGERYAISEGSFGLDALLTPEGMSTAVKFGRAIARYPVMRIYSSPIKRCVQTAECIMHGLQRNVGISSEDNLGNPGFHVSNALIAGVHFMRYGAIGVFEKFAAGEVLPGVANLSCLQKGALHWLDERCYGNGLFVYVTHDSLIAHFAYANNLRGYSRGLWVDYLDGIVVIFPKTPEGGC